jgi:hypothetical protein
MEPARPGGHETAMPGPARLRHRRRADSTLAAAADYNPPHHPSGPSPKQLAAAEPGPGRAFPAPTARARARSAGATVYSCPAPPRWGEGGGAAGAARGGEHPSAWLGWKAVGEEEWRGGGG